MDAKKRNALTDLLLKGKESRKDSAQLEDFVSELDSDVIESLIRYALSNGKTLSSAPQVVLYLFKGMGNHAECQDKRLLASKTLMEELQTSTKISVVGREELLSRFTLAMDKFTAMELLALTAICLESMKKNRDKNSTWKDLLPKLLNVTGNEEEVFHCGTPMKGAQYKTRIIEEMCMQDWKEESLVHMAIMFIDVTMPQDLHMEVVQKFCHHLNDMPPNELVTLTQQLLVLCKNRNSIPLFLSLQAYFVKWVYNAPADSQDLDSIDRADFYKEAPDEEANIRWWIQESAMHGSPSVNELIKYSKNLVNSPEKLIEPFLITVLLSLSQISSCKGQNIVDALKTSIIRMCQEEKKVVESAWMAVVLPEHSELESVFVKIIDRSHKTSEVAMKGMIELAFALLSVKVSTSLKESLAEKLWALGQKILVHLVKLKTTELGSYILNDIYLSIQGGQAVKQLIACLGAILLSTPTVISDRFGPTVGMMTHIKNMGLPAGVDFVKALTPVVRNNVELGDNSSLLENLIITLRKDLIASQLNTRLVAVPSFIHLLTCLEVKNLAAVSHSSQVTSSQYPSSSRRTQVNIEQPTRRDFDENESICLDCLRILCRCFSQQAEVKLSLYVGLCECVRNTDVLSINNMLIGHLSSYLTEGGTLPPLDFQQVAIVQEATALLKEPLAHLVYAAHQVTLAQDKNASSSGAKLDSILDSLTERMAQCTLEEFQLTDASELLDNLPESLQKREIVSQVLGVYEALMCYVVGTWTQRTQDQGKKLVQLYKSYDKVVKFCESIGKGKKLDANETRKAKGKKATDENETRRAGNGVVGQKPTAFKMPASLLDYATICRLLKLIHQDSVNWASESAANQVKANRDLRRYVAHVSHDIVKKSRTKEPNPNMMKYIKCMGKILYQHVICHLQEAVEYDAGIAAFSVECFGEILSLVGVHYTDRLKEFFSEIAIVSVRGSRAGESPLMSLVGKYRAVLTELVAQEDDADEPGSKKIPLWIVSGLAFLVQHLDNNIEEVFEWLLTFSVDTKVANEQVANGILQLLLDVQRRCKETGKLYDVIANQLLHMIGREDVDDVVPAPATQLALITAANLNNTTVILCNAMKQSLTEIDWVIVRLKSEHVGIQYAADDTARNERDNLKDKERKLNTHLSYIIKVVNNLTKMQSPDVVSVETTLLRLLVSLYTTMNDLTKYFSARATKLNAAALFRDTKFDTLVKLVGIHLSDSVCQFITVIQNKELTSGKKDSKSTALKHKQRVLREEKILPLVTFQKESFETTLIKLSNKSGVDLMVGVKNNNARDFRIKKSSLQNADTLPADESLASISCSASVGNSSNRGEVDVPVPKKKQRRS